MSELKPCPFCGEKDDVVAVWMGNGGDAEATCRACDASVPFLPTIEMAAERWNHRPTEDSLRREVEELKGLVRELLPHADEHATTMVHRGEVGGVEAVALIRRAESALAEDTRGGGGACECGNQEANYRLHGDLMCSECCRIASRATSGDLPRADDGASEA